jgi:uncharacterized SAM-binding protein YcdF (DUF218 family)
MFLRISMLLGVTALVCLCCNRPKPGAWVLSAAIALLGIAASPWTARQLLGPLQDPHLPSRPPEWGERNAILVLGGGNARLGGEERPSLFGLGRVLEGARLYRQCVQGGRSCKVIVSGGAPRGRGATESQVYAARLQDLGVAREDLVLESRSRNTFQNAQFSAPLLRGGHFDRVVLVSSGLHLNRSLRFLAHFGIDAQPVAGDLLQPSAGLTPSGYDLALAELALKEHWGRLQLRLFNALGWNPPAQGRVEPAAPLPALKPAAEYAPPSVPWSIGLRPILPGFPARADAQEALAALAQGDGQALDRARLPGAIHVQATDASGGPQLVGDPGVRVSG